ncbi:hypothetical protein ACIBG8_08060 [Nonomuraea sp. NPDC050556]|uniref:hypothetical protein n=1 Tax=Nonomuraea sp. NPDC050556 TaxID=3364369 RepID=UPI00378F61D4
MMIRTRMVMNHAVPQSTTDRRLVEHLRGRAHRLSLEGALQDMEADEGHPATGGQRAPPLKEVPSAALRSRAHASVRLSSTLFGPTPPLRGPKSPVRNGGDDALLLQPGEEGGEGRLAAAGQVAADLSRGRAALDGLSRRRPVTSMEDPKILSRT